MAHKSISGPLIIGKLLRPSIDGDHVFRPRLLGQLNSYQSKPFTLVSAPAGYGKSILISSWLTSLEHPTTWLSLDKNDNDLHVFLSYFIASIEAVFPRACRKTQALLNVPDLPPVSILSSSLMNELNRIEKFFVLVLDDFHLIKETEVHRLLTNMLAYPPDFLHLVIISRTNPPWPIYKLRSTGMVSEVRTQDLCFTREETETLLSHLFGTQIDSQVASALENRTEGWVTGLRLAVLSLQHRGHIDPTLLEVQAESQYVMEYLFEEILSHQPPEILQFLIDSAILGRFNGALCDAVSQLEAKPLQGKFGGWEFIDWLRKENMFLVSLDSKNIWYRYHHLLQRLLLKQLKRRQSAEEIKTLTIRASKWFAENGLLEEAVQYALDAGDTELAGRQIVCQGHDLMNDQEWSRLIRLLAMLPHDHIEQNPELLVFKSWMIHLQTAGFDYTIFKNCIERIGLHLDAMPSEFLGNKMTLKGHFDALNSFLL